MTRSTNNFSPDTQVIGGETKEGSPRPILVKEDGSVVTSSDGGGGGGDSTITGPLGTKPAAEAVSVTLSSDSTAAIGQLAKETTLSDHRNKSFGLNGGVYVTDTTAQAGSFVAITALEDAVIASMTAANITGTLEDIPLPAGVTIYGEITGFTLTSGKVIAYNA